MTTEIINPAVKEADSSTNMPLDILALILAQHDEICNSHQVGYYPDIPALAAKVRSQKNWSMGEIFVFAESRESFIVMKQIAPASCEMLTITASGIRDVNTAYLFSQEDLVACLQEYLRTDAVEHQQRDSTQAT